MSNNLKPLLLIDVDGVLNPLCSLSKIPKGFDKYRLLGYRVFLNKRHGEWLNSLSDKYELVWATTWEQDANICIGPRIGLPKLPFITFQWDKVSLTQKLPNVKAYVGDRRFVWLDDDLWEDAHAWAKRINGQGLLIDIDPLIGLTEKQVNILREWT